MNVTSQLWQAGRVCWGSGGKIPDEHDLCVYCLRRDYALAAWDDPAACMSCFCMTARQREAHCRLFLKHTINDTPTVGPQPAKQFKSAALGKKGWHSAAQAPITVRTVGGVRSVTKSRPVGARPSTLSCDVMDGLLERMHGTMAI